jgi:hypothetical protein
MGYNFDVILNPNLTTATDKVYMFRTDAKLKPFILQEETSPKVTVIGAGSEEEFKNRRHLFGTERIGTPGTACGSTPSRPARNAVVTTAPARRLLEAWHRQCVSHPDTWDQVNLADVIERGVDGLRVARLPSTYTRVFDDPKMGEPVLEHLQASRQLRAAV